MNGDAGSQPQDAQALRPTVQRQPSIVDQLCHAATVAPTEPATIVDEVGQFTFAELDRRSASVQDGLQRQGSVRATRIALVALDHEWLDFLTVCYGIYRAGATVVPIWGGTPADELRRLWAAAGCELAVAISDACATRVGEAGLGDACRRLGELSQAGREATAIAVGPDDLACIVFTSGTTGVARAVAWPHGNLTALNGASGGPMPGHRARFLTTVRVGTAAAQTLVHDTVGGPLPILIPAFDPVRYCELIEQQRVTTLGLVPSSAMLLLDTVRRGRFDLSSVRCVVSSSAPLPPRVFRELAEAFPAAEVHNAYTLSEGGSLSNHYASGHPDALGRIDDDIEFQAVSEAGAALPAGAVGQLWFREPDIPPRHLLDEPMTGWRADLRRAGWVATGDLGYLDQDGYVYFVDRNDDIIVSAGHKVSSVEIEAVLHEHPAVVQAAVVGVPHRLLGSAVVALARVRSPVSSAELQAHCAARLAPHKRPLRISLADELPLTGSGKVHKRRLRKQLSMTAKGSRIEVPGSEGLEELVLSAWAEVLGLERLEPTDDFLVLGGHSVLAMEVAARLGERLGHMVPAASVLAARTAVELASTIRDLLDAGQLQPIVPITPAFSGSWKIEHHGETPGRGRAEPA